MEATPSYTYWNQTNQFEHWLKHGMLPMLLIGVLLMIPKPWQNAYFSSPPITIELTQDAEIETLTPEVLTPQEMTPDKIIPDETKVEEPIESTQPVVQSPDSQPTTDTPPKTIQSIETKATEPAVNQPKEPAQINSTDVLNMLQNRTSMKLTSEFLPRTAPAKDFHIPEQQIMDWYADLPYLDESVDKPKLQMRFYAEGIEGNIEKFFDKITISKTFTTKYGTKIHCALIGVIAACGWK